MSGSDVIVVAPWLVFAVGVAVICARLVRSGHHICHHRLARPDGRRQRTSTKPGAAAGVVPRNEESTVERCKHGSRPP